MIALPDEKDGLFDVIIFEVQMSSMSYFFGRMVMYRIGMNLVIVLTKTVLQASQHAFTSSEPCLVSSNGEEIRAL